MNRRQLLEAVGGCAALAVLDACSPTSTRRAATSTPANGPTSAVSTSLQRISPPVVSQVPDATATTTDAPAVVTTVAPPRSAAPSPAWSPGDPASFVNAGPTDSALVALTFHFAGAPALAVRLLDLLKANAVTSTLFAIGDWLTAHPDLGHRALTDGHELGNHTKTHQAMLHLNRAQVHAEIAGGGAALVPYIGSIGAWFRPSGTDVPTSLILEEAGKVGYPTSVGYDVDSLDYTEPGATAVIANVNPALHAGAIVSLHFGHADTLAALPTILEQIAALGLHTATITRLLTPPGST